MPQIKSQALQRFAFLILFAAIGFHWQAHDTTTGPPLLSPQQRLESKGFLPKVLRQMRDYPQDLHFLFVGDINLGRGVEEKLKATKSPANAFPFIRPLFDAADIRFGNLECLLTDQPLVERSDSSVYMTAPPDNVRYLKQLSFDILTLANNHALDAGEGGLKDTINQLENAGIHAIGISESPQGKQQPVVIERKGLKIAFLSYNDVGNESLKPFSQRPFVADPPVFIQDIRDARQVSDIVVTNFHWGHEYDHLATEQQRRFADAALRAGARIVVGQHSHVLQEIAWDKKQKRIVAYGLGNFIFDLFRPSRLRKVRRSMILYVRVGRESQKVEEFYPLDVYINRNHQPIPLYEMKSAESLVEKPEARPSLNFRDRLSEASVAVISEGEPQFYKNWFNDISQFSLWEDDPYGETVLHERWQGDREGQAVGRGAEFSSGEFRKVLWAHVPEQSKIRIEYPPVRVGDKLLGFFGFTDWAAMATGGEPVTVRIWIEKELIHSHTLENRPGWRELEIDTHLFSGQKKPLVLEFEAAGSKRRYVGFNLWIPSK